MFSLRFTFFLLIILIVPYCLRFKYGDVLEIYPSIMLPSGIYKLWKKHDQVEIEYTGFSGKDKNGNWQDVNNIEFMKPIPDHYLTVINLSISSTNDTGYNLAGSRLLQQLKKLKILKAYKEKSRTNIQELNSWIRMKLSDQELDTLQIKKVLHKVIISTINGTIVKDDYNERIIPLDMQHQ